MGSGTWRGSVGGEFTDPGNWDPAGVPDEKATFGRASQTTIGWSSGEAASVHEIEVKPGAPSYTFEFGSSAATPALTIAGRVVASSCTRAHFEVAAKGVTHDKPQLKFTGRATAGDERVHYYAGPETLAGSYGGGIIGFVDDSSAGSASFTVRTGKQPPPKNEPSTVGGEVSFSNRASAGSARFTIYGSLGKDGDTFGNVVFHNDATAANARFTNIGGTVPGGDGGNTQFYDSSTAAEGVYDNLGATHAKANGGDVAFDGNSNGGFGSFYNYPAERVGGNGGVTSFNNNPPASEGASAGNGCYHNFGARRPEDGGGGHTEFTAKHGSPTADQGTFVNYGSTKAGRSSAGHTIFSTSAPEPSSKKGKAVPVYFPTAGQGIFWNHPGVGARGSAGFTEFSVYGGKGVPTAGNATFHNLGGASRSADGGYTAFNNAAAAGTAKLIAYGGSNRGYGGRVVFADQSDGGSAAVRLEGNGILDISGHDGDLMIGSLTLSGGVVKTALGNNQTTLHLTDQLILENGRVTFEFSKGASFRLNQAYVILDCPNLSSFDVSQFAGNSIDRARPTFELARNQLVVSFRRWRP